LRKSGKSAERSERLAAALRENLKKRKKHARSLTGEAAAAASLTAPLDGEKTDFGDEIRLSPDRAPR
jgi:hypothetical protein